MKREGGRHGREEKLGKAGWAGRWGRERLIGKGRHSEAKAAGVVRAD